MQSRRELAATLRRAMKQKNFTSNQLQETLGVSGVMVEKILAGEVVPSIHLEKQMIELLEIPERRVHRISAARRQNANAELARGKAA